MAKLRVIDVDGCYRGGLLESEGHKHYWHGRLRDGCHESMVCLGALEDGEWFLLQISTSPDITGSEENCDLMDHQSRACRQTVPQAFDWFSKQTFGPPPQLVNRAREFLSRWRKVVQSQMAQDLLFGEGDGKRWGLAPQEGKQEELELLRDLDLIGECHSGDQVDYFAVSYAKAMGRADFLAWMGGHADRLQSLLGQPRDSDARQHGSAPKKVEITFPRENQAVVQEGDTIRTINGARCVEVFRAVVEAGGEVRWEDLMKADIARAGQALPETMGRARNQLDVSPPRIAMNPDSYRRQGNRIRDQLGKLNYHWHQDGHGARWSPEVQ